MPTTRVPAATAMCSGLLSLPMNSAQRAASAAVAPSVVCPARLSTGAELCRASQHHDFHPESRVQLVGHAGKPRRPPLLAPPEALAPRMQPDDRLLGLHP